MKKILGTTLVAFALVAVSTVDAKVMKEKTTTTGKRMRTEEMAVKERVSNPEVKDLTDAIDTAINNPTEANKQAVLDAIQPEAMTEDERELAVLEFQEKDTMNRIAFRKAELASLSGWFDFIRLTSQEKANKADKAKRINKIIENLNKDLASIRADMAPLKPAVSKSWYATMKTVAKGLGVLGLLGAAAYLINRYTEGGVQRMGKLIAHKAYYGALSNEPMPITTTRGK